MMVFFILKIQLIMNSKAITTAAMDARVKHVAETVIASSVLSEIDSEVVNCVPTVTETSIYSEINK